MSEEPGQAGKDPQQLPPVVLARQTMRTVWFRVMLSASLKVLSG